MSDCGCKNGNVKDLKGEGYNVIGNYIVKVFLFIFGAILFPILIPVMWYYLFTMLFFGAKTINFVPSIKAIYSNISGKKLDNDDEGYYDDNDNEGYYDDNDGDDDLDSEDYELVLGVDEIK